MTALASPGSTISHYRLVDWPRHDPDLASLHAHSKFQRLFGSI